MKQPPIERVNLREDAILTALADRAMPDALFVHDHEGHILNVNAKACSSLGYSRDELLAMTMADLVPDLDLPSARAAWGALRAEDSTERRQRLRRKDGTVFPVEVHLALLDSDGYRLYIGIARDITDRVAIEEQLATRDRLLAEAQRVGRMGSWEWDIKSGTLQWSAALYALYGVAPGTFVPCLDAFRSFVHPDDREMVERAIDGILVSGIAPDFDFRIVAADGTTKTLLAKGEFTKFDPDGTPRVLLGVNQDISERKRLESDLRRSEERFRLAMEAAVEGIWDWNLETGEVYLSPGYMAMLGFRPRERVANVEREFKRLHPDDVERIRRETARLLDVPGHFALEFRMRQNGGDYCWVLSKGKAVSRGPDGKPRRAVGTHMDITTQKLSRAALLQTRDVLSEAQKIAHLGSFEFIVATGATVWSEEEFRIYGLDPDGPSPTFEELLARHIPADDRELLQRAMHSMLEHQSVYDMEHRILRPDGSVRWVHNHAHPYFDEHGTLVRYVGVTLDITERKRAEEESKKHNEIMQALVRQHVAAQTAAALAHELNQPLVSITAYSEVALRALQSGGTGSDRLARAVEGSHEQALRAGRVLRELLDHLHKGTPEPEPFDLNVLIRDFIAKLETETARALRTTLDLEPGLPTALGHRLQTEKVLGILVQNGIEAMEAAGVVPPRIVVTVRTHTDGDKVHVTVQDFGPGLDPEAARRVFEPFFSTKPDGLGLGLAISRSLIEAQGGRLWVDPPNGSGAVFHFTLPLTKT